MIKDNQERLNRIHVLLDALIIVLSYGLAWYLMIGNSGSYVTQQNREAMAAVYLIAAVVVVPVYLLLYGFFHLYVPKRVQLARTELANVFKANTIGVLGMALVLFLGGKNPYFYHFSRPMVLLFYAFIKLFFFLFRGERLLLFLRKKRGSEKESRNQRYEFHKTHSLQN